MNKTTENFYCMRCHKHICIGQMAIHFGMSVFHADCVGELINPTEMHSEQPNSSAKATVKGNDK